MSCEFEEIRCPRCGCLKRIEKRQQQIFCSNSKCGFYFNRNGVKEEYNKIRNSMSPLFDTVDLIAKEIKQ